MTPRAFQALLEVHFTVRDASHSSLINIAFNGNAPQDQIDGYIDEIPGFG